MLTLGSLFSGGGGWDQGAWDAGIVPIFAVEMEPWIAKWHRELFAARIPNHVTLTSSVTDVDYKRLPHVDFLVSSPPCQSTSRSGKAWVERRKKLGLPPKEASGTVCDPTVGLATLDAVDGVEPSVVLLENNADYAKGRTFGLIVAGLKERGFEVDWKVLRAEEYGVASGRERLVMRASIDELPPWPTPGKRPSWWDLIRDLVDEMPVAKLAAWQAKGLADNPPPPNTPLLIAGGNPNRNSRGYLVHRTPSQPAWATQLPKNTSGMRVIDQHGVCHLMSARAIARLQGFPDDYDPLPASRQHAIHILGNSVPPLLAEQILEQFP